MLQKIIQSLRQYTFLGPKELFDLASVIKFKQLNKGEHLVREGEYNYNVVTVLKGLLCHYILDEGGFEKALLFVPEGMNSGAMQPTMKRKPADENIVALENTILLCSDIRRLEELADKNLRIQKFLSIQYKQVIAEAADRIRFLVAHTPEERYLHFRKAYPHLEKRIKLKDLASYLCITDTSLSRIRARLTKK